MTRAKLQTIESKQVVEIALKSGQKKRESNLGFSVHNLLRTSIEKMSLSGFDTMLMKIKEL